jgi:hypothetical protein
MTAMLRPAPVVPPATVSPVLQPLLTRLGETACGHAGAAPVCDGCAVQVQRVLARAQGTGAIVLDEAALRRVLVRLAEHAERELFALCGTAPSHVYWTGSMHISALAATLTSAPLDAAIEAAAQICLIGQAAYTGVGRFRAGVEAAGRTVDVFRVQVVALAADARRH